MSIIEILENYIILDENTRQKGKTTALREAATKIGAEFVCENDHKAKYFKGTSMYNSQKLIGSNKPIIFDHYALSVLFKNILNSDFGKSIKEIESLKNALEYAIKDYEFLLSKKRFGKKKYKEILQDHNAMKARWNI